MNNEQQSKKMFALALYNLVTPEVYQHDSGFLYKVWQFAETAGFDEEDMAPLRRMLKTAIEIAEEQKSKQKQNNKQGKLK